MKIRLLCLFLLTGCSFHPRSWSFIEISDILSDGKWVYEGESCSTAYMSMSFDIKENIMTLSLQDDDSVSAPEYEYQIIEAHQNGFLSQITNEERLDDHGSPVKWNLVLLNDSTFYWRRDDWGKLSGTKRMVKCPQ